MSNQAAPERVSNSDASSYAPVSPDLSGQHAAADDEQVHPQHQGYRGSISHVAALPPTSSPLALPTPAQPLKPPPAMPRGIKSEESMPDADAEYTPDAPPPPAKTRGKKKEGNGSPGAPNATTTSVDGIEIKTHFPVARIKRIMQADDDVGKVAQVTPVVVSKALELFMISLVTKAAAEAKTRNSKRINSVHLKQAVQNDEQFDFLKDIVDKIADAPGDKGEGDAMDVDGKKKKASGRRKKKTDDSD